MRKLIILLLLNLLSISHGYSSEKRLVLLIGNSSYNHSTVLSNPANDINAMSEKLSRMDFDVMVYKDLGQIDFKKAIDEFGTRLRDYDIGMFYYAGHGLQINGINYLVPVDAQIESELDIEYNCINAGRLLAKMESGNTKTNIIILDACRNNPFKKSWNRSINKQGLAFMEAPVGSIIAYSTAPGETASDGTSKNSLYTESLLKYIDNPKLNSLQVFQEVRKTVRAKSNGNQIPWESTSLESDFYFNQSYDETAFSQNNDKAESGEEILNRKAIISKVKELISYKIHAPALIYI